MLEQNNNLETMESFFNKRAHGYDEHMHSVVRSFDLFYTEIASPIQPTTAPISVLDLGCGTGIELDAIFRKAPNAQVTAVDISEEMLKLLAEKYEKFCSQLTLVQESYLTLPLEERVYDVVISVMTMHHWQAEEKSNLYQKIKRSLKPGGRYVEGDYVVEAEEEQRLLAVYEEKIGKNLSKPEATYHIDIPFTLDTQEKLFLKAGFKRFKLIWREDSAAIYFGE